MALKEIRNLADCAIMNVDYVEAWVSDAIKSRDDAKTENIKDFFQDKINDVIVMLNHSGMVEYNHKVSERLEWEIIFDVIRSSIEDNVKSAIVSIGCKGLENYDLFKKASDRLHNQAGLFIKIKDGICNAI